jgi:hypothetical protein
MNLPMSWLIVLLYSWLTFKLAENLPDQVRHFSLRSLFLAMTVAAVLIAAFIQMGVGIAMFFLIITLLAGGAGVIVGTRR